jgi:hypothetical protein
MKNKIIAFTYSTSDFLEFRNRNKQTALNKGKVDVFFDFGPEHIDLDFFKVNEHILSQKRGAGLWLWKPYFFHRMLNQIADDDILIYTDAASYFVKDVTGIIQYFNSIDQDIMGFELPLQSDQWTKEETFYLMNGNKDVRKANQISASFIIVRKTKNTILFAKEWLNACCNIEIMSEATYYPHIVESKAFISHRYDQSIFSILYIQNGFRSYRDPSQYGLLSWEYILSKDVIYIPSKAYSSSDYSTIFFHCRNVEDIKRFHIKTRIKLFLAKFQLYRKWEISRRKKIVN